MADEVYLSLWLTECDSATMLAYWRRVLEQFPYSEDVGGVRNLIICPFQWGEAPAFAQSFAEGADPEYVVAMASEFLHADYAYEAEMNWDVWVPKEGGGPGQWERVPRVVAASCFGPEFEPADGDERGHIQIACGLDSLYLPVELPVDLEAAAPPEIAGEAMEQWLADDPREGVSGSCYRDNILQLLAYSKRLEEVLPVENRRLWSGSGEDMAELIREAWG